MAKVKNIGALKKKLKKVMNSFTKDSVEMNKTSKILQNQLRISLRNGVLPDGRDIPANEDATNTRRGRLASVNPTSKYYSQYKANATFTGDTVRGITVKAKGKFMEITASGRHKKLKGVRGKPLKGSNADIADIVRGFKDRGVVLMGEPKLAKAKIKNQFIRFLRRKKK